MSVQDAIETVLSRNVFYRDGYRLLLRISIIQGLVIILMVVAIVAMLFSMETRYIYFATTADGRIINIVPLNEPFRERAEITAWGAGKSQEIMRFGYNNFRQNLQQSSASFTPRGWESFTKALKDARILEAIEARKLTVSLEIEGAPEIKNQGLRDGVYSWLLHFPAIIKFDGSDAPSPMPVNLILLVVRVSTLQNSDGVSIEQWIAAPR